MRLLSRATYLVSIGAGFLFLAVESCRAPQVAPPPAKAPAIVQVKPPVIRVGLGTDFKSVEVVLRGHARVYEGRRGEGFVGEASERVIMELSAEALMKGLRPRITLRVGSYPSRAEADGVVDQLHRETSFRATVVGQNEVRIGPFSTKAEAEAAREYLSSDGYPNVAVQEEAAVVQPSRSFRMAFGTVAAEHVRDGSVYIVPVGDAPAIEINSKLYRGTLQVLLNASDRLTLVNIVNLEDYIRGVVPNELPPKAFPQIEALKAQAVAARTYVLRNMGRFEDYDICATPMCQVYEGASSEDPLSDRAVAATAGEVATYGGRPIEAMYTSTCGGSTEAVEKIFAGVKEPYLRAVPCYPERVQEYEFRSTATVTQEERDPLPAAVLSALGIATPPAAAMDQIVDTPTARDWIDRAAALARRAPDPASDGDDTGTQAGTPPRAAKLAALLLERFGWTEKAQRLQGESDLGLLVAEDAKVAPAERRALGFLISERLLDPGGTGPFDPSRALMGRELLALIVKVLRAASDPFVSATFERFEGDRAVLLAGRDERRLDLSKDMKLFSRNTSDVQQQSRIVLFGGEPVEFLTDSSGAIVLLIYDPARGLGNDRGSKYYRWDARMTVAELTARLARSYPIGQLLDLSPEEIGESGRVIALRLKGSAQEVVLRGIQVRLALGLRDSLFVVDRIYGAEGKIAAFQFSGKGWGHGVGMCQVGAFGMALKGDSYSTILKTYYPGIEIEKRAP